MTEQEAISVLKMIETHGSLPTNAKDEAINALEEVHQYRAIGTPEECRAAVEKQFPKKKVGLYDDRCPNCSYPVIGEKFCPNCGQHLRRNR